MKNGEFGDLRFFVFEMKKVISAGSRSCLKFRIYCRKLILVFFTDLPQSFSGFAPHGSFHRSAIAVTDTLGDFSEGQSGGLGKKKSGHQSLVPDVSAYGALHLFLKNLSDPDFRKMKRLGNFTYGKFGGRFLMNERNDLPHQLLFSRQSVFL